MARRHQFLREQLKRIGLHSCSQRRDPTANDGFQLPTHCLMNEAFSLQGQVALVTGGGSGIGLATAECLHACGATVVVAGRRVEALDGVVSRLRERISHRVFDVTDYAGAPAIVGSIEKEFGALDILINNAGLHLKKPAEAVTEEEFGGLVNVHLLGSHALSRHASMGMRRRGRGSIIYMASMASLFGIPQVIAYTAVKTAMVGVVKALATEWSGDGVRVNAIAPGWIETEMSRKALAGDRARKMKILGRTPMKKLGQPADIGWAAAYLSSPAAAFVTGVCLPVDGGASIGF